MIRVGAVLGSRFMDVFDHIKRVIMVGGPRKVDFFKLENNEVIGGCF